MKIFSAADIHLGSRRLDGHLPESGMAEAFRFIDEGAVREKADVFLIAGDSFDRPKVEPPHPRQAGNFAHSQEHWNSRHRNRRQPTASS